MQCRKRDKLYIKRGALKVKENDQLQNQMKELYGAILSLETPEECHAFFEDLCTVLELKSLSGRLEVAKQLSEHHVYSDIVESTGASTATISRVNRALQYGNGGYKLVLDRLKADKNG